MSLIDGVVLFEGKRYNRSIVTMMAIAELDSDAVTVRDQPDALVLDGGDGAIDHTLRLSEGASARCAGTAALQAEAAGDDDFGDLEEGDDRAAVADVVDDRGADQSVVGHRSAEAATVEVVQVDQGAAADVPAAGGHDGVVPPGGGDRDKQYGGDGDDEPEDVHGRKEHDAQRPERPEIARKLGEKALAVADPRTEAARRVPEQVEQVEAIKVVAARYKEVEDRPDPFAMKPSAPSAGQKTPDFSHMGEKGDEMAALVRNIKDPAWQEPWRLYPTERLITAAHKATIARFDGVRDELKAVNRGLIADGEKLAAAHEASQVHLADAEELDGMQADLARVAGNVPTPETVGAIVGAYQWLVTEKGLRVYERPEPGILANFIPANARYSAHVGPVETSLDRAKEMAEARDRIIAIGSEMHQQIQGIARRDETTLTETLLGVLESAKHEISGEDAQAAVRDRRPEAGQLVAAESYVLGEITAAVKAVERLDPDFLKDESVARAIEGIRRPVLRDTADKARADYETAVTQDLNREVTRARDIVTGAPRVLRSIGNGQRRELEGTVENLDALTGTPERPSTFTREEAGLLVATVADPARLTSFGETVNRVRTGGTDDEALQLVARERNRAIAELRQVDPDTLIGSLRDKMAIPRVQDLLSVALSDEQQRGARIALGRYFNPDYDEPPLMDDEADAEPDSAAELTDEHLGAELALVAADADLLDKITANADPEEGLLEIMEALGLDISGDEIDVVLDWANRALHDSDQPVDVEALLLGMLGELEAARLDAASALEIEADPTGDGPEPEAVEAPRTIEEVVTEYENLGFTVFPVGEQAFREAERIVDEAGEGAVIDLERVEAMVQFARAMDTKQQREGIPDDRRHMFIGRGPLGNRGMVTTADGQQVRNEYLVLVMLQADDQGHIRQQCWADSPIAERNASYAWDSDASGIAFPNWEKIFGSTKQSARDDGGARRLKHTAPAGASVHATMMQRVWSLLTGPPADFYRDTRLL